MPETLLEVDHLKKVYESSTGTVEAIRDISFSMRRGELVCIVGPSGCGKTTLLKCIAGLLRSTEGTVELDGKKVAGPPPNMALVFQEYGRSLYPWLTVRANVELPLKHKKLSKQQRDQLIDDALEAVGLEHAAKSYPWQLSGGMQQRVAIARALSFEPAILLMDEPFGALDEMTRERMNSEVLRIWQQTGITVVFVTHSIPEAVFLSTRVVVMSARPGRVSAVVPIDLPRDRTVETREMERYFELVTQVREALRSPEGERRPGDDLARVRAEGLSA